MTVAASGQALALARMRDTCTVTRLSPADGGLDQSTGLPTNGSPTAVYSGVCRLRMSGAIAGSSSSEVSGDRVRVSEPTLSVPVTAARLLPGDLVLITAVPADDPAGHLRLNLRLRVADLVLGTDMTAQRVTVEAVTG